MHVVHKRCAGLDVHKKTVVACVLTSMGGGRASEEVRTFSTMTEDLERLAVWLVEQQVEQVCLESSGIYWWPVFNILEEQGLPVTLVNPQRTQVRRGHKTDRGDAIWLADLLRHGLVQASFIPPAEIRALRELTRYRANMMRARAKEIQHLMKTLESANIKLDVVASDVLGVSGYQMLTALAGGEADPEVLAQLAQGRLRAKLEALRAAFVGRVQAHHRLLIQASLDHVTFLQQTIERLDLEVERALAPFAAQAAQLDAVPGIGPVAAAAIVAEIGVDMRCFPTPAHLASWAGVCPGNKQSGGKRLSSKTTKGDMWLRRILGEVAWSAIHEKHSVFRARYYRLKSRLGAKQALVAIMHQLLKLVHRLLLTGEIYHELGDTQYQQRDRDRQLRRAKHTLERAGYTVVKEADVA
jgi:transposase